MFVSSFSSLCKVALVTSLTLGTATIFVAASSEPAFANNGNGNGNGNSKSNRGNSASNRNDGDRGNSSNANRNSNNSGGNSSNSNSNSGGNSANSSRNSSASVSSELPGVTAAHAAPAALSNAAPSSVSGKLATYRNSRLTLIDTVQKQNVAYAEYQRLSQMTAAQAAAAYPSGDYSAVLANATATYVGLHEQASRQQTAARNALLQISGGRTLSDQAVGQLHALLGM